MYNEKDFLHGLLAGVLVSLTVAVLVCMLML
jgi:hypothetical protein